MRLDKFLKNSRIIKRRSVAKAFCDEKKVSVNGKIAKSSQNVKVDDILQIQFGSRLVEFKVLSIANITTKDAKDILVKEIM